jgi:Dihaem cytochrome c
MNALRRIRMTSVAALAVGMALAARVAPATELQDECGACHIAYPAALLPATSWQQIMRNLGKHFGTDASLDAATAQRIEAQLVKGADKPRLLQVDPAKPAPLRITEMRWFTREHREIPASRWRAPKIGSASRCEACHVNAAGGQFDDED